MWNLQSCVFVGLIVTITWLILRSGRRVKLDKARIPADKRHYLPAMTADSKPRLIGLGKVEQQLVRLGLDYGGFVKIFFGVRLRNCGGLDKARVKESLRFCQQEFAFLRCRVTRMAKHLGGEFVAEEDPNMKIPVEYHERSNDQTWLEHYIRNREALALRLNECPFLMCVFSDEKNQVTDVLFELHHYCCDGTSLGPLMHSFLGHLFQGEEKDISSAVAQPLPIPMDYALDNFVHKESGSKRLNVFFRGLYHAMNYAWLSRSQGRGLKVVDPGQHDKHLHAMNRTRTLTEVLSVEDSQKFRSSCKAKGVTLTCAATAALLEACGELHNRQTASKRKDNARFQQSALLMASCRNQIGVPESDLGFYVGLVPFYVSELREWGTDEDAWQEAARLQAFTRTQKDTTLWTSRLQALFFSTVPSTILVPTACVSSWGSNSPIEQVYSYNYGDGRKGSVEVECALFTQNHTDGWPTLSMYTVAERLHFSFFFPYPRYSEHELQAIWTSFLARIYRFIGVDEPETPTPARHSTSEWRRVD